MHSYRALLEAARAAGYAARRGGPGEAPAIVAVAPLKFGVIIMSDGLLPPGALTALWIKAGVHPVPISRAEASEPAAATALVARLGFLRVVLLALAEAAIQLGLESGITPPARTVQ